MIQKTCALLYPSTINTRRCWFYQMFQGWYNPRTNKFEYNLNLEHVQYNIMEEEIKRGFTISDHSNRVRWNLPLDATYVHCRVATIFYKIDIYITIWVNKLFPLRFCHN
jgi:hypothetical protein